MSKKAISDAVKEKKKEQSRKRVAAYRARRKELGQSQFKLWLDEAEKRLIKNHIQTLRAGEV